MSVAEPAWVQHAIFWQVYPLGFVAAPQSSDAAGRTAPYPTVHRLSRLLPWLDYVIEMGASGLALGPLFESATHGYDTTDYFHVDPRLGDDSDFDELIREAHARGLRVVLDGVFNHVGRGFAQTSLLRQEEGAASGTPQFAYFEGHDSLLVLNHDDPAVVDYVVEVMTHWLGRGADGWRLDAAYAVPAAFWAKVLPRVREIFPEAYIFGEVIHGEYAEVVEQSGLDSLTQYEVWKAVWSSISEANFFELDFALGRHNGYLESFVPLTFVGNHDVTRLATVIADERHRAHALVVLMTIGGTPTIYYGDEQGLLGLKEERFGGDDAIRPEYPEEGPAGLAPVGWEVYRQHQQLIGVRRRHPWLHSARTAKIELTNEFYVYEVREVGGAGVLVAALNLGDAEAQVALPFEAGFDAEFGAGVEVAAGDARVDGRVAFVAPHGWAVLQPLE